MVSTSNPKTIEEITDLRITVSSVLTFDRILRVKRHRGDVGMPSRILGAMSVLVTCPAADKLFVIANARRNCWPLWEAIPGPVTHRPDPSSQTPSR